MSPFASWLQTRVEAKLQAGATSVESVGCFRSDETCAYFITLAVGIAPLPASVLVVLTSQSGMDDSASSAVSDAAEASGASVLPDADSLLAAISAGDLGLVTECLTRSPIVASEHFRAAAQVPIPSAEIYEALLHASEAQGRTDMARYDLAVNAALAAGSFHEASRLLTFCTALDCELVHWCFSKVAASPGGAESVLQLHKSAYDKEVFVVRLAIAADSAALLSSVLTEESSANTWPAALVALASAASGPELQITACLNQITDLIKCHRKDVNTVNENYESALHMLARDTTATAQAVLFLLQLGADVDQVNGEGESALHMIPIVETDTSAESGNHNQILQKATVLINHGANVNAVDNEGCTPIMYAATAKDDLSGPLIQLLTSAGANSQLADMNGETALMKAAASAQSEAVLRQLGVNISNINLQDCTGQSALHHCLADEVDSSQNSTASTLLDMGASVLTQDQDGCNALHLAVRASDASPDLVRRIANLVKEQGAISMTDNYGQTALMLALDNAEVDGIAIVELLLSFGCAVNRRDESGNTALHYAQGVHGEAPHVLDNMTADVLLQAGADNNIANMHGETPAFCPTPALESIDQAGPDVQNLCGQTLLHVALSVDPDDYPDDFDFFANPWSRELLEARDNHNQTVVHVAAGSEQSGPHGLSRLDYAAQDNVGWTPLFHALAGPVWLFDAHYFDEIVQLSDVNHTSADQTTPLHLIASCCEEAYREATAVAAKLLDAGARVGAVDGQGRTPLMVAVSAGLEDSLELVTLFLQRGALVNVQDQSGASALWLAAQDGLPSVVQVLLEHGAVVGQADNAGVTPLLACIEAGDEPLAVVEALVKGGANVNEPDSDGMTPLVAACHTSQHELVKELLAARADPNLAEADGQTPLIAAAENGNVQMIQNLLEAGADVDATDSDYQTPLMAAAAEGCIDSVKVLLSAGADASHCDEEGTTVLMVAEFAEELMDMLLSAGADVNAMDGDDETALYKAARLADAEYVEWLLRHGADPYQATVMEQTALDAAYMAQGEALSDANGVIALLEAFTVDDDMDTESQNGSEVVEASGDEPDSPNSLLA